jgi:hypothetical protein
MPAKSKAQQHLMAAASHGATFPMARQLRGSMTLGQMGDFASTPTKGLPSHVKATKPLSPAREKAETGSSMGHPHKNLGAYLHKSKKG